MRAKSPTSQMIQLTDFDGHYSSELQFRCDQKTTIQDLIRFLKEKIDQGSDYKIYFQNQRFEGDKNLFLIQLLQNSQVIKYQKVEKQGTQYSANSTQYLKRCSNSVHSSQTSQQQDKCLQPTTPNNYYNQYSQPAINNGQKQLNITQCSNCKKLEQFIETLNFQLKKEKENSQKYLKAIEQYQKEQIDQIRQKDYYEMEIIQQKEEVKSKIDIINNQKKQYEEYISQQKEIINQLTKEREQIEKNNYSNQKPSKSNSPFSQVMQKSKVQQFNINQSLINSDLETSSYQTITYLRLKCGHQQELEELKQIVLQSAYSKQVPKCQKCNKNISSADLRKLGNVGDQYLMIKAENNLGDIFTQLQMSKFKLARCSNNQCSFFCIQQNRLPQNNTYCPSCLSFSVNQNKKN